MADTLKKLTKHPPPLAFAVLASVALASLNTKIAGLAWLMLLIWAAQTWWQRDPGLPNNSPPILQRSALVWLWGLLVYAGVQLAVAWGWHGACCTYTSEVNSYLRLLLAAAATVILVRYVRPWTDMRHHINLAIVTALATGSGLVALVAREQLPSYPIPWAGAMVFLVCVLIPHAWDASCSSGRRWVYATGSILGIVGVLLSQSRGTFFVLVFPLVLLALHALHAHRRAFMWAGATFAVSLVLLTSWALAPSDPLRLRLAMAETQQALQSRDFNSSLGARVYLVQLAWHHVNEAPCTGVGAAERLSLLKNAGLGLPHEESEGLSHVRTLGHVHNQYLHHAMDNGLLGLIGFLALLTCMVWICFRLRWVSAVAALQMGFITLAHSVASLSNVNLAHNYYALMWSLCTALVFVQAIPCRQIDRVHA